jgi:hypothetical protein
MKLQLRILLRPGVLSARKKQGKRQPQEEDVIGLNTYEQFDMWGRFFTGDM